MQMPEDKMEENINGTIWTRKKWWGNLGSKNIMKICNGTLPEKKNCSKKGSNWRKDCKKYKL